MNQKNVRENKKEGTESKSKRARPNALRENRVRGHRVRKTEILWRRKTSIQNGESRRTDHVEKKEVWGWRGTNEQLFVCIPNHRMISTSLGANIYLSLITEGRAL